ncbi:hypothetical protein MRB53_032948 [Persea americana]|uniref:Uncharacterized protein n=1 Tax=Persea americana TaxID=3435 RepID=A0ACC2KTV1_PERAE|nr:hypothetical protein MRB53_032948 [Persea americana]
MDADGTTISPTNIAIIKYWGKRDETLILSINDSISTTLDLNHLCMTTTVVISQEFDYDRMWLNTKSYLREIRRMAGYVEDEKKGIRIRKDDWKRLRVYIASYNNFPIAVGLVSSAAGFACLGGRAASSYQTQVNAEKKGAMIYTNSFYYYPTEGSDKASFESVRTNTTIAMAAQQGVYPSGNQASASSCATQS